MLTVSGRAPGHDQSDDPRKKVPAGHSHTRSLSELQNVSSLSHVYLSSMQNQPGKAARCLPLSLLLQPLVFASQRGCLRPSSSLTALFLQPGVVMLDPSKSFRFYILQILLGGTSTVQTDISSVHFLSPIV